MLLNTSIPPKGCLKISFQMYRNNVVYITNRMVTRKLLILQEIFVTNEQLPLRKDCIGSDLLLIPNNLPEIYLCVDDQSPKKMIYNRVKTVKIC